MQRQTLQRVHEHQNRRRNSARSFQLGVPDELGEKGRNGGKANLIVGRLLTGDQGHRGNSLLNNANYLAEREGFEPPLPVRVNLISSQAPSAGLGHLSRNHFNMLLTAPPSVAFSWEHVGNISKAFLM
jgi:hypothetical protein